MPSDVIISVENLGKKYRIKHPAERQRYTALRDVSAQEFAVPFKFLRGVGRSKIEDGQGSAGVSPDGRGTARDAHRSDRDGRAPHLPTPNFYLLVLRTRTSGRFAT